MSGIELTAPSSTTMPSTALGDVATRRQIERLLNAFASLNPQCRDEVVRIAERLVGAT
jgi:hypothetical protein